MTNKDSILKKKCRPFEKHLQQIWPAEKIPVVVGRLVKLPLEKGNSLFRT